MVIVVLVPTATALLIIPPIHIVVVITSIRMATSVVMILINRMILYSIGPIALDVAGRIADVVVVIYW